MAGNPPSRHLWVGGLPEEIGDAEIKDLFTKYGKVEGVKILPQRYPNQGVAAFIDFYDVRSAVEAREDKIVYQGCELRTNFKTKSTERFEKYDHSLRRDQDYVKELPYSGKRVESPTPPPEREKEPKEKSRDKEKSRGKESSSSSTSSSSSSGSSSSDGSSSESEGGGGGKRSRKKGKAEVNSVLLRISNLAPRPERVLQDGLYYEFTRYCPTAVVRMYGDGRDISAIVKFDSKESCKRAYTESQGLVLFGNKVKISPVDRDEFPTGGRDIQVIPPGPNSGGMHPMGHMSKPYSTDDIDPQATHSLFVGNIPKNISVYELRDIFQRFGDVVDVEIKKMSGSATYGFVLFYDLLAAVSAKQFMDGENIHGNNIRVGFGKGTPSKMLWVDGIDPDMPESSLDRAMAKYGKVVRLGIDRQRCSAMVQFDSIEAAKDALTGVKGTFIGNSRRIMTDFANRDARAAFFSRVESGEPVGPPRGFPGPGMYGPGGMGPGPRGMMMPRPGVPMMGMGRGGFPPMAGPPMDMYYYNPYMGEGMGFYGQPPYPRGPPIRGMRRFPPRGRGMGGGGHYEENYDDYGDELRAFTRKREIEKEERKWKERRKRRSTSDESGGSDSEDGSVSRRKKKTSREKDKSRKAKKDKAAKDAGSDVSSGEEEVSRKEEARLRATQRSRDLREKLKRKSHKKEKEGSASDAEPHPASDTETDLKKSIKKSRENKEKEKERKKEPERDKHRGKEKDRDSVQSKDSEIKSKEKVRSSEKERERKKEKDRELLDSQKKETTDKQSTSSDEKGKDTSKQISRKRPQPTKLKSSENISDNSSRSSSESKTPTSPPPVSSLAKTKAASPPRTPPTTVDTGAAEDEAAHVSDDEGVGTKDEEKMDTGKPLSPQTEGKEINMSENGKGQEGDSQAADVPETPESPPARPQTKKKQKPESDLSSGEEFPDSTSGSPPVSPSGANRDEEKETRVDTVKEDMRKPKKTAEEPVKFKINARGISSLSRGSLSRRSSGVVSPPTAQWSPDTSSHRSSPLHGQHSPPPPLAHARHSPHPPATYRSPPPARLSGEESEEGSRKSRKLPRCYQLEEEKLKEKQPREVKEHHHPKPHALPTTPSPPPAYASHRRRPMHSPPPPDYDRRWRRGRHYSPGHQYGGPRRYSRSPPPPGYPQSPPYPHSRGRSPYSASPPPRPRTPIQRPRDRGGPRHRYESPPYDMLRGKHGRRGSSPMRHLSPSPPLSRPRSPGPSRRPPRRYSRSPSPPRRSPLRRKERSPSPGSSRSSPRYTDERLEARKYGKKPSIPVYSRSPSPKTKRREGPPRDEYPDAKRRRMDDTRVKSPPGGPPLTKDEPLKMLRSEKSQLSPYAPSAVASSERHASHHSIAGKESQQHHPQGSSVTYGSTPSHQPSSQSKTSAVPSTPASSSAVASNKPQSSQQQPTDNLMDLLRRYPVMWQGHLTLKNESAAVQLHFLSGNVQLAKSSLPGTGAGRSPALRIAQRMRLEQTQLEGVHRRMQNDSEHCLLLALPCGRDASDVRTQTHALKNSLISYLLQKQAAGIINVPGSQTGFVLHIFPPCQFSQTHLSRVAPDLLSSASDNCHLMIVIATM